jgi:hypothetical protein
MRPAAVIALILALLGGTVRSARGGDRAVLENVRSEWQNAYGAIIYTVLADVKNVSDGPLQSVRVKVELLDKNGQPVVARLGYNVGAEILDDEGGRSVEERLKKVKPIAAGGTDLVRISLDKSDIGKPFRRAQVSIVEVH